MSISDKLKGKLKAIEERVANFASSSELVDFRKSICNSCEFKIPVANVCSKCGCVIEAKIRVSSAVCPKNKW